MLRLGWRVCQIGERSLRFMSASALSFHPIWKRPAQRRQHSAAELAYFKRVAKNKAKARVRERRAEQLAEEHRILKLNRERYQQERGLTDEDMEWMAEQDARDRRITQKRRAAKLNASPKWASFEKMETIFREAARLQTFTGIKFHVDHIVPLVSDIVCGLHCEDNLQVLMARENIAKNNHRWPDMP